MAEDTSSADTGSDTTATDLRTFLIADVRGYTRFTQDFGDEAASALAARFGEIAASTAPAFGGRLIELRGDEALCVFGSARQAVRAAIDLQRRLRTPAGAEDVFPLGVGVGLDAGEAVAVGDGFRGAALNRAARLCAAAAGGEILVSEGVVHLAGPVAGVVYRPPRAARLKGFDAPVRWVLVIPETPLPPLPPLPSSPRRLSGRMRRSRLWLLVGLAAAAAIAVSVVWMRRSGPEAPIPLRRNSVAVIDPSAARVVGDVPLSGTPGPVEAGFGRIWVGEPDAQTVVRIDPASLHTRSLGVGIAPSSLATAGSSVLAYDGAAAAGAAIDPARLQSSAFTVPSGRCRLGLSAAGHCYGGDVTLGGGHVWASETTTETVWRLDPQSLARDGPPVHHVSGDALTYGAGYLWAYGDLGAYVYQIDPRRDTVVRRFVVNTEAVAVITQIVTGNNLVWVVVPEGHVTVIDPTGQAPQTIALHTGVRGATADGHWLWVTSGDGRLYQISLYTRRVVRVYQLHHQAVAVTVAGGRVWVSLTR